MAGLGALLSVFYFVRLPTYYSKADSGDTRLLQEHFARALSNSTTDAITKESINASYYTMSGFALVTAILLFVGLKKDHERVYHPNQEVHHYEIKPRKTQEEIEKEKEKSNESQVRHQETATDEDAKNMWQTFLLVKHQDQVDIKLFNNFIYLL